MSLCLYIHVQKVDVWFTIKGNDLFDTDNERTLSVSQKLKRVIVFPNF